MYNHETQKYTCPFCQIVKGEETILGKQEEDVVFRDDLVTVFIAGKWWRSNLGHLLLITNDHIENIYDLPEKLGYRVSYISKKVAIALKEVYGCDGVSTRQHNEPAGNQEVWHYHLHVFPRYIDDNLYLNHNDIYWPTAEEKKPYADKLKAYFSKND